MNFVVPLAVKTISFDNAFPKLLVGDFSADLKNEACLIGQFLQFQFPQTISRAVAGSAVGRASL